MVSVFFLLVLESASFFEIMFFYGSFLILKFLFHMEFFLVWYGLLFFICNLLP